MHSRRHGRRERGNGSRTNASGYACDRSPAGDAGPDARRSVDPTPVRADGPVASITRARIRPSKALTFWRAVPPVSSDLHRVDGLRLAFGIGEAPIGLQGTFSLWDSAAALREFAHRRSPHIAAIQQTARHQWYVEELFARFAVVEVDGSYRRQPIAAADCRDRPPEARCGHERRSRH